MGFGDFFRSLFSAGVQTEDPARKTVRVGSTSYTPVSVQSYMTRAAWRICKDYIAAAVSKAEIRTFLRGKEVYGEEYYRWNIKPNVNQTSTEFWIKAVERYYDDGELLILPINKQLIVADGFTRTEYALMPAIYDNVSVGDFTFSRTFTGNEVMYFAAADGQTMKSYIASASELIDSTIGEAVDKYRLEGGERGTLDIDSLQTGSDEDNAKLEEILNEDFSAYFKSKNAIVPLYDGMKYNPVTNPNGQKTSIVNDIGTLFDMSVKLAAEALKIPPALILGNVADTKTAVQNFLTFCIDPFMNMITEGANACLYGTAVLNGSYLSADSSPIEHIDVFSAAQNADKLIAASILSTNEVRRKLSEPRINAPWADEYARTKNYETVAPAGADNTERTEKNEDGKQEDGNEDRDGSGDESR